MTATWATASRSANASPMDSSRGCLLVASVPSRSKATREIILLTVSGQYWSFVGGVFVLRCCMQRICQVSQPASFTVPHEADSDRDLSLLKSYVPRLAVPHLVTLYSPFTYLVNGTVH